MSSKTRHQEDVADMDIDILHDNTTKQTRSRSRDRKRSSLEDEGSNIGITSGSTNLKDKGEKKSKQKLVVSLFKDTQQPNFWFGFPTMELLAQEERQDPIPQNSTIADLVAMGLPKEEAEELTIVKMSYPKVLQKLWPSSREDGIEGQHVNITQLPFDVDLNHETGLSYDYHISLHFEKSKTNFTQEKILKKVILRLEEMKVELGSDIGEPLAVLCHTNTKIWSEMVKIHLRNPNPDAIGLLKGTKIFAIPLDEDTLPIAKISKSYDTIVPSSHTSLKIEGEQLKTWEAHHLLKSIVTDSFARRQDFEITKVTKGIGDYFAWCGTTSLEQLQKILKHTITIGREVLRPVAQTLEGLTKEEITKRNCLVLIAKTSTKPRVQRQLKKQ